MAPRSLGRELLASSLDIGLGTWQGGEPEFRFWKITSVPQKTERRLHLVSSFRPDSLFMTSRIFRCPLNADETQESLAPGRLW